MRLSCKEENGIRVLDGALEKGVRMEIFKLVLQIVFISIALGLVIYQRVLLSKANETINKLTRVNNSLVRSNVEYESRLINMERTYVPQIRAYTQHEVRTFGDANPYFTFNLEDWPNPGRVMHSGVKPKKKEDSFFD